MPPHTRALTISARRSPAVAKFRTAFRLPAGPAGSKPWMSTSIASVPRKSLSICASAPVNDPSVAGLVLTPCALISLNAVTHSWLESDGGGAGRNRFGLSRMNGLTEATHGVCGARYAGGVRRHTPGPGARVGNADVDAIGVTSP